MAAVVHQATSPHLIGMVNRREYGGFRAGPVQNKPGTFD
jgi:hypothetical protein